MYGRMRYKRKQRNKKNTSGNRLFLILLAVCFALYLISRIFGAFSNTYATDVPNDRMQRPRYSQEQVLIEARIVEAEDSFSRTLGVKLGFNDMSRTQYRRGYERVLDPNGSGEYIDLPIKIPVRSPSRGAIYGGNTASVSFRKANLKLEVTPQIAPNGEVVLDVDVTKDSVGAMTTQGYAINTKHVKTQVTIDNGGTLVIGGIYQEDNRKAVDKVPLLGDIPLLGNLFKTTTRSVNKNELLIF